MTNTQFSLVWKRFKTPHPRWPETPFSQSEIARRVSENCTHRQSAIAGDQIVRYVSRRKFGIGARVRDCDMTTSDFIALAPGAIWIFMLGGWGGFWLASVRDDDSGTTSQSAASSNAASSPVSLPQGGLSQ